MTASLASYWGAQLRWPERPRPQDVRGEAPAYSAEEIAEVLQLISPLRLYRDGRWISIPTDLATLRANELEYLNHLDEINQANFRESGEYKLAVAAAERQRQEEAADRREQKEREVNLSMARDRRIGQLIAGGLSPLEAAKMVDQHSTAARG
jgi:hypothetical protein